MACCNLVGRQAWLNYRREEESLAGKILKFDPRNRKGSKGPEGQNVTAPADTVRRFKAKLSGLKRSRRFVRWGESAVRAGELQALLQDIQRSVTDPETGIDLLRAFYETDKGVVGNCDDSDGYVGDVYRCDARDLFLVYSQRFTDKDRLAKLVLKLVREDDYGVRDTLINCATEYLPEPAIRFMVDDLQKAADSERTDFQKRHRLILIESLAYQLKDAPLFEKTRIASWGKLSTAANTDIARAYLVSGDARTALSWLERIPGDDHFGADKRDMLLLDIYGQLGETEKRAAVAWRVFRRYRSLESLEELLTVIGAAQREAAITNEVASIIEEKTLSLSDAGFLIELGRTDDAAGYLLKRREQLNGDYYGHLVPLAKSMEEAGCSLAATAVYRALLDSILRRGQTGSYRYGIRYLKKLDKLTNLIKDWRGMDDHESYVDRLRQIHGRKSSFWSGYKP